MRNLFRARATALLLTSIIWGASGFSPAFSARLPYHPPIPEPAPRLIPPSEMPKTAVEAPLPNPREQPANPVRAPIPEKRPEIPKIRPKIRKAVFRPTPPPPPARFACRADLRKLGVKFEERAPLFDRAAGCSVPNPIAVSALSSSVKIGPKAVMNCALADELAHFIKETASPLAEKIFGSPIVSIRQASAYVCRDRHGTSRISEHAFGNAVDIAEFVLEDGAAIEVKDYGDSDPKRTAFLNGVRKAACGPFRTVLGPGADADHSLHFHFDLEPRKSKSAFCQ
jgi:hypothetical protein